MSEVRRPPAPLPGQPLSVLHCLRAPVGGLFRHVIDLATMQAAAGHDVGVICAASGDSLTEARLLAFAPQLKLGLHRLPMGREVGIADFAAWRQIVNLARELNVDILHGHGAKGGAYARLAARALKHNGNGVRCFYTPHGGSLHYAPSTLPGMIYGALERRLERFTDGLLFESQFAHDKYARQIGTPACATKVVVNGIAAAEFENVVPVKDAADFIFVGELRHLKGVDVALDAIAKVKTERPITAVFVGAGPDAQAFAEQSRALGLESCVTFPGAMRAREAFSLGRVLLMPSRAESLPYVVLEAIGAGLPVLATDVGGIPEIVPPALGPLLPAGNAEALAAAMRAVLDQPGLAQARAIDLRLAIRTKFSVQTMAAGITDFYTVPQRARRAA